MGDRLRVLGGGGGQPLLILLHGLGANAQVWAGARCWRSAGPAAGWRRTCPATAGRRRWPATPSARSRRRSRTSPAARTKRWLWGIRWAVWSGWPWAAAGSASRCGPSSAWASRWRGRRRSSTGARALAERPVQEFASRADAAARYLRVSGLAGLVDPDGATADAGLLGQAGSWRLALDPRAFGVGAPDMPGLLAACRARVLLARGETDPMVSTNDLAELRADAVTLTGLGHNAHVEDPSAVLRLLEPLAAELSGRREDGTSDG